MRPGPGQLNGKRRRATGGSSGRNSRRPAPLRPGARRRRARGVDGLGPCATTAARWLPQADRRVLTRGGQRLAILAPGGTEPSGCAVELPSGCAAVPPETVPGMVAEAPSSPLAPVPSSCELGSPATPRNEPNPQQQPPTPAPPRNQPYPAKRTQPNGTPFIPIRCP